MGSYICVEPTPSPAPTDATTTEEVGCCMGDSVKTNAMCNNRVTRQQCDRSSSCTFVKDGVLDEGDCDFGTTKPPEEPGCCYGNPDIAYSKRWMEQCKDYGTERECLMLEDAEGNKRCTFEPMNDYMDCEAVWPTTTETPTEAPGCCRGTSYKSNDKCRRNDNDQEKCEKQGCEFVETYDFSECEITTTETPTTTQEPGCCKADSKKREDMCLARDTKEKCEKSASCIGWISGEQADCSMLWPTTTTTTDAPGCCYGDSYKANDKCRGFDGDRDECERKGCRFMETDNYGDCDVTTTETPTCCKGTSRTSNDACNEIA